MDDTNDMRNMILSDLIDKMHGRMADKMFPPDMNGQDEPAASGIPASEAMTDVKTDDVLPEHGDEMTDEELEELMKQGS